MSSLPTASASLDPDGLGFVLEAALRGVTWRGRYAAADLPRVLRFYRGLRDRHGGAFARFHQPTVSALETLQAELRARASGSPPHGPAVATAAMG